MLESEHFTFNGVSSKDMGVKLVSAGSGLYKESFLPTRKITEQKITGNPIPFFQYVDEETLSFSFAIVLEDWVHKNQARAIARWLYTDYYQPFSFDSNPDVIIYGMFINKSELNHNGVQEGYVTLNLQSKSPYMYSPVHEVRISVNGSSSLLLYNNGDLPLYITAEIINKNRGNISIKNENTNQEFLLTDALDNEEIYVDFRYEYAISSFEERLRRYLGDNLNDVWFSIKEESSVDITFKGNFDIILKYQYAYLMFDKELGR